MEDPGASWDSTSEIDWLLVGQTKASLIAGACLAIGLRFAGTSDQTAKHLLIAKLRAFRDARRTDAHPARMASMPTPGMDLDRSTLETCQSVVAVALGMVMAGTGDLSSLQILRSLRKRADLETSYGVHMATHMAIGYVFLGGGRYTFDRDPLSIAVLLMAAFPRFPVTLTDNRCHLQAIRHLYVLAAKHRCVEAVEVDTRQPVDLEVALETSKGTEMATLPRLMLASGNVRSITLQSERYWPVTINRAAPGDSPAAGRWMRALEFSRRLYVKRRSGHLPHRHDHLGAQGAAQAWFPSFTAPQPHHLERLLQIPKADVGGSGAAHQQAQVGGVALAWLQRAGAEGDSGAPEPGTLAASPAEWAAALCCAPPKPLPDGTCELDFDGVDDGSLTERFGALLVLLDGGTHSSKTGGGAQAAPHPAHVRFAHWLHECVVGSKLEAYPFHILAYLQTQHVAEGASGSALMCCCPSSASCSAAAVDQLITVEQFYRTVRGGIGARHAPLLSEDFLVGRCAAVREAFAEGGRLAGQLKAALRAQYTPPRTGTASEGIPAVVALPGGDAAILALFSKLHGFPGHAVNVEGFRERVKGGGSLLGLLPRLRRALPGASAQGLRLLAAALAPELGGQ